MKIMIHFTDIAHCNEFKEAMNRAVNYHQRRKQSAIKNDNNGLAEHHLQFERTFFSTRTRLEEIQTAMLENEKVLYQGGNR